MTHDTQTSDSRAAQIFEAVVDDPARDGGLANKARAVEPGNFLRHVLALSASKVADGLLNPKLVLAWLLTHLGAGAIWGGLLVPVREALALLPQLLIAPRIAQSPVRKWFWAGGALVQGLCAAGIAVAGLTLSGQAAGATIVALLALLAVARSVCSASYKDILGKTVGSSRRGTATGMAGTVSAIGVIAFALVLMFGPQDRFGVVIAAIGLAAAAWIIGASILASLREVPGEAATDTGTQAQFSLWRDDPQLRRFILARSLLVGTALAPPYLVMLQSDGALGVLGALVLVSALASLVSSWVWGRVSDQSSRRVLILAGLAGATALGLTTLAAVFDATRLPFVVPVLLFVLMIAHEGVRQGRTTHLVDMAGPDARAGYTALSNTVVGLVLLGFGGAIALIAAWQTPLAIALMAVMCVAGAITAHGLQEVQDD